MAGRLPRLTPATGALLAGLVVAVPPGFGQERRGGPLLTFGISSSLRVSDNYDLDPTSAGTTVLSDTRLSFGIDSTTRSQELHLDLDSVLRLADRPGRGVESDLQSPGLSFTYIRRSADSRLTLEASYRETEVDAFDPALSDEVTGTDLILDTGQVARYRAALGLETGLTAPLGFSLDLSRSGRDYSATTDPDLYDSRTDTVRAAAILRPDAVTEGRVALTWSDYTAENVERTERRTRAVELGLSRKLSEAVTVEGSLGYRDIEEEVAAPFTAPPDRSGATARLAYRRALPRGSVGATLSTDVTSAGQSTTLALTRALTLPTGGLEFSLGATQGDGYGPELTGSLNYTRDLPTGRITASLSRTVSANDEAEVQRTTRAALDYSRRVNELSAVSFDLGYAKVSGVSSGTVTERERATFTTAYTRSLTPDWDLSLGYEHRYVSEQTSGTAQSNAVFMTLGRSFSVRP